MSRIPRGQVAGHASHVLNRGNGGAVVFHTDGDDAAFLDLLALAKTKFPVQVFGFCLMPNHFPLDRQQRLATALGLESTLRRRGRPQQSPEKSPAPYSSPFSSPG